MIALEIAKRDARLEGLQQNVNRLLRRIDIRSKMMADVPGGATGLLVRVVKGKDPNASVYRVDIALVKELRSALRQAAEELGQLGRRRGPGRPRIAKK
jgi:hypothetical protein